MQNQKRRGKVKLATPNRGHRTPYLIASKATAACIMGGKHDPATPPQGRLGGKERPSEFYWRETPAHLVHTCPHSPPGRRDRHSLAKLLKAAGSPLKGPKAPLQDKPRPWADMPFCCLNSYGQRLGPLAPKGPMLQGLEGLWCYFVQLRLPTDQPRGILRGFAARLPRPRWPEQEACRVLRVSLEVILVHKFS
jgi:hypothetical protein